MKAKANFSTLHINEHQLRFIALFTALISLAILFLQNTYLSIFLVIDFGIRAFTRYPSVLSFISTSLVKSIGLRPKLIFAPPKKFAAKIGFFFSLAITTLSIVGVFEWAGVLAAILFFCAFLESAFKICLGCYMYDWFVVPFLNRSK